MATARVRLRVLLAVLLFAACESHPIVILGRLPPVAAGSNAGPRAGAGGTIPDGRESAECDEVDPVCGADGITYQNYCRALIAGVTVVKHAAC